MKPITMCGFIDIQGIDVTYAHYPLYVLVHLFILLTISSLSCEEAKIVLREFVLSHPWGASIFLQQ